jgi:hypothetical protein
MRESKPVRQDSIAVDWHNCEWSPRIAVRSAISCRLGLKPLPAPATHFTSYTLQFVHH